jgi:adenosine deaminase
MNIREMPKVELHCHLEACFRAETVMEVGKSLGLDVPQDRRRFDREWLLTEPMDDLETALKRFVDIQRIWHSEEVIERMTFEACEYAVEQGIKIMEFRYSPDFIAHEKPHLSFQSIHDAILRGLRRADHFDLATGLIGIVQKTLPLEAAAKTVDFMIDNRETFIGLDFADQHTHDLSHYAPLVARARDAGLRLTAHAGEEPVPDAPLEVLAAIEVLGAERIGHGIHIVNDDSVLQVVRERNVALEICPTSNWLTSSVETTAAHPVRILMEQGVPVTINSDDPGLFGIDLCREYEILELEHGYTAEEFNACNDVAAAASFLPLDVKRRVWPRKIAGQ